ncbi:MAG: pseudouridine synthase [Terracidiphilus sp.]
MKHDAESNPGEPELEAAIEIAATDAIGAASAAETTPGTDDEGGSDIEPSPAIDSESVQAESTAEPQPAPKLDRLQKILAQAGVASRRHAEELITQGRVQVNGHVVTTLGSKADPARDHIRVDGKLIHSAERLRYFMLNKPKGFVTTVSDPEGRPTVMQFFEKLPERLYPVGRLDYQSEGLLLVTNDGELANRLTRAASGVEKTYLVKVSGRPTEAELDILRQGVAIERGKPGSSAVNTAPARIRQVRLGDNPWYEVVLIEGRNRELRKMFQEIGHFVEKIRRVGYGPLVLDVEPGKLRELDPEELVALRKTAEGKWRTPKSKEIRRRNAADAAQLPTVTPRPILPSPPRSFPAARPFQNRAAAHRPTESRPRKSFGTDRPSQTPRPPGQSGEGFHPAANARPVRYGPSRPAFKRDDRSARPPARFAAGPTRAARPGDDRAPTGSSFSAKPAWKNPGSAEGPPSKRPPRDKPFQGASKRPFRRDDQQSFAPSRPTGPSTGPGRQNPSPSRSFAPRGEGAGVSGSRGPKNLQKPGPSFRREAGRSGSGWKPKPGSGATNKSSMGGKPKPAPKNAFGKSGSKPFRAAAGGKRSGPPRPKHR